MGLSRTTSIFSRMFLPKVKDLMTTGYTTLDANAPLMDALQVVMKDTIRCVIVTREGEPVGILTRRDMITKCFFERSYFERTTLGDVISQPLITIGPNENVLKAYKLMMQKGIGQLPVIEQGKVIGRIRVDDIKHLAESPITVFYRVAYFLLGVLVTIVALAIALAW